MTAADHDEDELDENGLLINLPYDVILNPDGTPHEPKSLDEYIAEGATQAAGSKPVD